MNSKDFIIPGKLRLLFPIILVFVTILVTTPGLNQGEFWWSDESRHAMDGIFIMDLVKDFSFTNLYRYTEIYFAKYPALGLTWYPPFFATVEALFFSIFGISEVTARVTVLFFTLLAVIIFYIFIQNISDEIIAFFSSILFITTPIVSFWAGSVMLELPVVALIIISCYFFYNYVILNKQRYIYYLTLALIFSLYTKQTAAFMFPVFISYILIQRQYQKIFNKHVLFSIILFTIAIAPLVLFTLKFGAVGLSAIGDDLHQLRGETSKLSIEHWLTSIKIFVNTFVWPIRILTVTSIIVFIVNGIKTKKFNNAILFFILWIIWWYFAFSYVVNAEYDLKRCCIYAVPAIAAITVWPITMLKKNNLIRWAMIILVSLIAVYQIIVSYNQTRYYITGYNEAAKFVMDNNNSNRPVLFSGYYGGNFVFHTRKYDHHKQSITLRADKILTSWSVFPEWGYRSYVSEPEDIYEILDKYGTKYIVVEDKDVFGKIPFKILRDMLEKDSFLLEKTIKIESNMVKYAGLSIHIYKYKKEANNLAKSLTIEFPLLNRKINVPLESLLKEAGK